MGIIKNKQIEEGIKVDCNTKDCKKNANPNMNGFCVDCYYKKNNLEDKNKLNNETR